MTATTINVPNNFHPRDYQLKLFQAMDGVEGRPETKKRRALLRWHRRAGKDKTCFCYMAKEMVKTPGTYYYFFPTYQQGRMALWEAIDRGFKVMDHLPPSLIKRRSNQDMVIELHNGSIFRIVGTDNIDRIVGTNPIGCVFSEYSLQDTRAWTFISPILAENKGWAIFNGTPRGRNHMYKLEKAARAWDNWYVSALTVKDSKLEDLLKDKIQEDLAIHGQDYVDQEYYVAYSAGARGAIYMNNVEQARAQGRIGSYPPNNHRWVDTFWDIGVSDATAIWFRQVDGSKQIWIDYYEGNGKDIAEYVNILQSKGYRYRTHYLPHDGNQRKMTGRGYLSTTADQLSDCCASAGLSQDVVVCPKLPIQDGINGVRALFSQFYFNEGLCEEGIEKLSLYHRRWDPKKEAFIKEPVHDWTSHCADAMRTVVAADTYEDFQASPKPLIVKNDYDIFS
jgi:hypothetical protein